MRCEILGSFAVKAGTGLVTDCVYHLPGLPPRSLPFDWLMVGSETDGDDQFSKSSLVQHTDRRITLLRPPCYSDRLHALVFTASYAPEPWRSCRCKPSRATSPLCFGDKA